MKLEKIIDILGEVIGKRFIIKRMSIINPTFKAFTSYSIELYEYIDNDFALSWRSTENIRASESENVEKLEKRFLKEILEKYYGVQQILDTIN